MPAKEDATAMKSEVVIPAKAALRKWQSVIPAKAGIQRAVQTLIILLALATPALTRADDDVMLQAFYWDVPRASETGPCWYSTIYSRRDLINKYFRGGVWLPVPYKGASGGRSMGYDPFDHYDLGEYNQKGAVATRFGTFQDLKKLLSALTVPRICDIVINHMMGGESESNPQTGGTTHTRFRYVRHVGRGERQWEKTYSDFHPNQIHPDRNQPYHNEAFGPDVCQSAPNMRDGMKSWMAWLNSSALTNNAKPGYTGWRFDFAKGIDPGVIRDIITDRRLRGQWAVGEYWDGDREKVKSWILQEGKTAKAFDFPLFYKLQKMCNTTDGSFDMRQLDGAGLVGTNMSGYAVTFAENHDTDKDPKQRIYTDKMLAYAYILHAEGRPCVFWKDYFNYNLGKEILPLIQMRRTLLAGSTTVLLADDDAFIAQRNGMGRLPGGILILNDHATFQANRTVRTKWRSATLKDYSGHIAGIRRTDSNGSVELSAPKRGYALWAPAGYRLQ
jgi:alpha-amylase